MSSALARPPLAVILATSFLLTLAGNARAQTLEPIGSYVIDLRGSMMTLGSDEALAAPHGLRADQLAGASYALDIGGHVYLYRWKAITFGLGGSALFAATSLTPGDDDLDPLGPTVNTRFTAFSPQLSFNFGHRNGWSYLSAGLGTSRLTVYEQQPTIPEQRRAGTLNYGGGARWFVKPNLALSLDLRFYAISPLPQLGEQPTSPRMTLLAGNIGISVR